MKSKVKVQREKKNTQLTRAHSMSDDLASLNKAYKEKLDLYLQRCTDIYNMIMLGRADPKRPIDAPPDQEKYKKVSIVEEVKNEAYI